MESIAYMITGASSGIGEACARRLAAENVTLFLVARRYDKLCSLSKELPGTVIPIQYDLLNLDDIKSIFDVVQEQGVKLNGFVYCAGINADCPIKVAGVKLMQEAMTVNTFAFLEMGKYFYNKKYSKDGASIVAISSIASMLCEKGMVCYSASKAALNAVVKTMSKEFIRRKICVNAILPAGVDTPMASKKMKVLNGMNETENAVQQLGAIPPSVIADYVNMLLSDMGAYITGELITIGAGRDY